MNAISNGGGAGRIALAGVCLDAQSYKGLSHFVVPIPGASAVGNVERYVGADREVGRLLERAQGRVCIIDFDQNTDEAMWANLREAGLKRIQKECSAQAFEANLKNVLSRSLINVGMDR